jgi:hypothetical protein
MTMDFLNHSYRRSFGLKITTFTTRDFISFKVQASSRQRRFRCFMLNVKIVNTKQSVVDIHVDYTYTFLPIYYYLYVDYS